MKTDFGGDQEISFFNVLFLSLLGGKLLCGFTFKPRLSRLPIILLLVPVFQRIPTKLF